MYSQTILCLTNHQYTSISRSYIIIRRSAFPDIRCTIYQASVIENIGVKSGLKEAKYEGYIWRKNKEVK